MIRRTSTILLVSLLLVAFMAMTAFAAKATSGKYGQPMQGNRSAAKMLAYSFADETSKGVSSSSAKGRVPIGSFTASVGSASPGVEVGYTYYDYQHNCSMGRMIETGPHSDKVGTIDRIVHNGWMYLADATEFAHRCYAYGAYNSDDHSQVGPIIMSELPARGGYVNVDVTADNRALVGGHFRVSADSLYQSDIHFDGGPAYATFPNRVRVPDSVAAYGQVTAFEAIWPKFFFQFGTDTVLHVASEISMPGTDPQAFMYFRKPGFEGSTDREWTYPPYVVDTVEDIAQDVIGQRNGDRICIVWFAALPYDEPWCDTCSAVHDVVYEGLRIGQQDNDIYYQESYDQGSTFNPRVNISQIPIGEQAYKPFCDASVMYDSEDNLHIIWSACLWPPDLCIEDGGGCFTESWYIDNARLFHWSENVPYIRPIADQTYEVGYENLDSCWPGAWNLRIAKMSISECDNKLYSIWTQFNDPKAGIVDDCAIWAYRAGGTGAANGDLYVSVSEDWGMTWDYQRNLTNSYTPRCDASKNEFCDSDHWSSMSRAGWPVLSGEDWSGATVVDPSGGSYTGDYYIDIQFVNDLDAGGIVMGEGSWTNSPIKWFRIPCVEPIPAPSFACEWGRIGDPHYQKPGVAYDTTLMLENIGNTALTYAIEVQEDNGTPGWLTTSGFSGNIPSGLGGQETGIVSLNANNMTAYGNYFGRLHITGNDDRNLPFNVEIELIIADTIVATVYDVVSTNTLSLIVGSNGNQGRSGWGTYNMDYHDAGDCDTTAVEYLYDGGPMLGRIIDGDTVFNWALWGAGYFDETGMRPVGGEIRSIYCDGLDAEVFYSGVFVTQDSTIGFEKYWFAPKLDVSYIIEYTKMFSYDGNPHTGLVFGECNDWDIPWDYHLNDREQDRQVYNYGHMDVTRDLLYQQGYEAYGDGADTLYPFNCQYNDARFGGNALIASYLNGSPQTPGFYGGFIGENDSLQGGDAGVFHENYLWQWMASKSGLNDLDSCEDIHTVFTYGYNMSLGASDVFEVVGVLASVMEGVDADLYAEIDAANTWFAGVGGHGMFANLFDDSEDDMCYHCCRTMGKFYDDGMTFSILDVDNFTEWLLRDPGGPDPYYCEEEVDVDDGSYTGTPGGGVTILDLDYIIGYLLRGDVPDLGTCPTGWPKK